MHRRDPLADDILRTQRRFHETLHRPHLQFHIRVFAESSAVARLIGSVLAESAFKDGSYRLVPCMTREALFESALAADRTTRVAPLPVHEHLWKGTLTDCYRDLARLSHLATVQELKAAFGLPVASYASPCCIRKNTDPPLQTGGDLIVFGHDDEDSLGGTFARMPRGFLVDILNKHLFVSGMTGSGKTTACIWLMAELAVRGVPFLVIETAKTEYRTIKMLKGHSDKKIARLPDILQVYTPGNEDVSPLRFSPLQFLEGIGRDEHIENTVQYCQAAMPLAGPMLALLGESLERVYDAHPDRANPPVMSQWTQAAHAVLAEKGYSGDTNSDIRAAIDVRLGILTRRSIGRISQCRQSVPSIDQLFRASAVLELDRLPTEPACLLTLSILNAIREHLKTQEYSGKGPRYVVFIEEAHNIVGTSGEAKPSEVAADPKAHAAQFICRMLAELRALGVGLVIIDQHPSAVAPEVIKNTATKLAFLEVNNDDRDTLAGSMLLGPMQKEDLARLKPGEAFLITEGYHGPRRIRTPKPPEGLGQPPLDIRILPYLKDEAWFKEAALARSDNAVQQLHECMERFDEQRLALAAKAAVLLASYPRLLQRASQPRGRLALAALARRARTLRQRLAQLYRAFCTDSYRKLIADAQAANGADADIAALCQGLTHWFETTMQPDTLACLAMIDGLIGRCAKPPIFRRFNHAQT